MLNCPFGGGREDRSGTRPTSRLPYFTLSTESSIRYLMVALVASKYLIITSGNGGRGRTMTAEETVRTRPAAPPEEPGLEPPDSIDADSVEHRLQEDLFQSLVESADYVDGKTPLPAQSGGALQLATPEAIRASFADAWENLSHSLGLGVDTDAAFKGLRDLVMYDIPDGTRSTLSVPVAYDVEADAGLYCLALVHTLASVGARTNVILTHTSYNRERGPDETRRFLEIMMKGIDPFRHFARRHAVDIHLEGVHAGYELEPDQDAAVLARVLPERHGPQQLDLRRVRGDGRGHVPREGPASGTGPLEDVRVDRRDQGAT